MSEKKDNSSKQVLLSVLGVAILVVAVVGVSFAAFTFVGTGTKENTVSTGAITMTYSENSDGITLTDAMPMTDEAGKALVDTKNESGEYTTKNTFRFSVGATVTGTTSIAYEIAAIKKEIAENALENNDVKLYLASVAGETETAVKEPAHYTPIDTATEVGTPEGAMILASGTITSTQTTNYVLKMWLDKDYQIVNGAPSKSFTVTLNVYGKAA